MERKNVVASDVRFVDLGYNMTYGDISACMPVDFYEESCWTPAKVLCNIFSSDKECVVHECENGIHAVGFIAGVPTHAVISFNKIIISISSLFLLDDNGEEWKDTIIENYFGFSKEEKVMPDTTIYDSFNNLFIQYFAIHDDTVVLEFLYNSKSKEDIELKETEVQS